MGNADVPILAPFGERLGEGPTWTDVARIEGVSARGKSNIGRLPDPGRIAGDRVDEVDVDTRTDVYSLGVMLYELLTGFRPFDTDEYQGWAKLAAALEREPPPPSRRLIGIGVGQKAVAEHRRTDASTLVRVLRGDLDWIVMKAMEKDRSHRYETADSLAVELTRYLDDEPVLARPPSARYRMGKFVRRHKVSVAFSAALAALLVGVAINQTIQTERIRLARDRADTRRGQAEGLIYFMLGDLREKLAPIGCLGILDDIGDQAMTYFSVIPEQEFSEQELSTRSQALYQIGQVRLDEGDAAEATAVFGESLRLAQELSARDPGNLERLFGLSQSHFWMGNAAFLSGDLSAAETQFQAYVHVAERLVDQDGENLDYRVELAYAHSSIGSVREVRGDLEGAVEAYSSTLAPLTDLVDRRPDDLEWIGELAETHNLLGVAYQKLGQYDRALEEYR